AATAGACRRCATGASPSGRGRSTAFRRPTPRSCTCSGTWYTSCSGRTMSSDGMPLGECPIPNTRAHEVLLATGSGRHLSAQRVVRLFLPAFRNPLLEALDDQALVAVNGSRLAFTTDSYVVTPIFFPGGDIGELAVNGTVNDLAVGGAEPLCLSLACILEEGLPLGDLQRIVESARRAAERAGGHVVTGDTKVLGRGRR